jgi:hypothetical protein
LHTIIPLIAPSEAASLVIRNISICPASIPEKDFWVSGMCPIIIYMNNAATGYIYLSAELDSSTSIGAGWADLYIGMISSDAEMGPIISYARARKEFKRWPYDTDTERMEITKTRTFRIGRSVALPLSCYCPITYHTITNYVSGKVIGYIGDGSGISINVRDNDYLNEIIWEGSTNIGGSWNFNWYNSSTNVTVESYQDETHKGICKGCVDTSLNITFSKSSYPTAYTF